MQQKLIAWAHDHPTAGHAGQQKTLFRLVNRVFWKSLRKDVYKYVATCEACQQFKYKNAPLANPMQMHIVNEPWHTIGIDIMGPLPVTSRQKRYLLVIVDYFTRWVELFPMTTTTSTDIAQVLIKEVCSRFGLPKYILSDNGPQFVSDLFHKFCSLLGIEQKFTANYHPQTNMTERVNRTLKPMLAIFAKNHPHSWDKELQKLAFAIRTSVNETTGETPAFLMFGRDPKIPLDLLINEPPEKVPSTSSESIQTEEYKKALIHNLKCTYSIVREHSEVEKISQKMKYDRHTSQREFNVGDLVWIAINNPQIGETTISRKFEPKYQGPCRIIEKIGPATFVVQRIHDGTNFGAVNIDRIKIYFEPNREEDLIESTSDDQQNEPNDFSSDDRNNQAGEEQVSVNRIDQRQTSSRKHQVPARYRD
jgi:hypothetical protein